MGNPKKQLGVQQNLISPNPELKAVLEYICSESNKLHNCAVYYARQIYFKTRRYVTSFDLNKELGSHPHFSAMCAQAAQQTCGAVGESVKSFSELLKKFKKGELENKPSFPKYRKHGMHLVAYPGQALKLVNGQIRFPLGLKVKAWFGLGEFYLPMPTNLDFATIKEVRILPRNGCLYAEFVYPIQPLPMPGQKGKCLGLDHGLNNWITGVSNVGTSFIVDGKPNSVNQPVVQQICCQINEWQG